FSILNLNREPFSNSPDPDYFYHSRQHLDCLQKLELSLHLRRGLNVIIGDVGTGKTTLCRQIIRRFANRKDMETHLILDPLFRDPADFLSATAKLLSGRKLPEGTTDWQAKEFIKHTLFRKGVDQKRTTILIIDEGQKIPVFCLELLREFLNYETNDYKLLQIVIFAQQEFEGVVRSHPNFGDRINLYHHLKPLSLRDTRLMIKFRLEKSSSTPQKLDLFTLPGLIAVHRATGGYPRKIINLCHQCILAMIIQNRSKVGYWLVQRSAKRVFPAGDIVKRRRPALALGALAALAGLLAWGSSTGVVPLPDWAGRWSPAAAPAVAVVEKRTEPPPAAPEPPPPAALAPPVPPPPEAAAPQPAAVAETAPSPTVAKPAVLEPAVAPAPVADVPPPAVAPTRATRTPEMLGSLTLRRNETISGLIQRVYGNYSARNFRSIILANPQIDDPDRVEAGQVIQIPAIPAAAKPPGNRDIWWVRVAEKASLQEAFDFLRSYPESVPAARMIPYWAPKSGLRFALLLKQAFGSAEAARLQLKLLPASLSAGGEVASAWPEQAVFFADPWYGIK
ncbi:MAG: AAA family ATPase, partial [Desulfobacterales bacterium]|nr:AAA family ATPase [Desulfobacterales bacterium]